MTKKLRVGVLGATGAVGQNYLLLLENHPWFEVTYVAASPQSAGKKYLDAVANKWFMDRDVPMNARYLIVGDANKVDEAKGQCDFVFSSIEGSKGEIKELENSYAAAGFAVVSNNSAHRWTDNIPVIVPEINPHHLAIIRHQREANGWRGFIVAKPNCSILSKLHPTYAWIRDGKRQLSRITTTTLQAVSGAGYPGVPSLDMIDNIVPFINGEEEKTEKEPLKIMYSGIGKNGKIILDSSGVPEIRATCTRVPVIDGHMAVVTLDFSESSPPLPSLEELISTLQDFKGVPQDMELPSAPNPVIIYRGEENRPQPRKDRNAGNGMAVTVGRINRYSDYALRFIGLSHNTNRGAAGGAILTAELLREKGYLE